MKEARETILRKAEEIGMTKAEQDQMMQLLDSDAKINGMLKLMELFEPDNPMALQAIAGRAAKEI